MKGLIILLSCCASLTVPAQNDNKLTLSGSIQSDMLLTASSVPRRPNTS